MSVCLERARRRAEQLQFPRFHVQAQELAVAALEDAESRARVDARRQVRRGTASAQGDRHRDAGARVHPAIVVRLVEGEIVGHVCYQPPKGSSSFGLTRSTYG